MPSLPHSSRTTTTLWFTPDANLILLKQNPPHLHLWYSPGGIFHLHNVKEVQYLLKSLLSLVQKPNSPSATSLSSLCSFLLLFSVPISYRSTCHKTIEFYIRKTFGIIKYHLLIETKVLKHRDQRVCQKPHSYFIITSTTFQRQSCHDSMKAAEEQQEMLLQ